ncbi:MAG: hypothetical protein JSR14_00305 [Proteobacteria bacterium]|nr:hypothetical protein [Pseudomonadota bacterium]
MKVAEGWMYRKGRLLIGARTLEQLQDAARSVSGSLLQASQSALMKRSNRAVG